MKIFRVAGKPVEVIGYIDEEGKLIVEIPDGQGVKKGCETIGKIFGGGPMDHSNSVDWKKEQALANQRTQDPGQNQTRRAPPSLSNQLGGGQ